MKAALVIIALVLLYGIAARIDMDSEEATAKMVAESPKPFFEHPLPYAAKVTQSGPGITEVRTRHYIPSRLSK